MSLHIAYNIYYTMFYDVLLNFNCISRFIDGVPAFSTHAKFGPAFYSPVFSTHVFFMVLRFPFPRFQRSLDLLVEPRAQTKGPIGHGLLSRFCGFMDPQ